jgi:hypothetical protein
VTKSGHPHPGAGRVGACVDARSQAPEQPDHDEQDQRAVPLLFALPDAGSLPLGIDHAENRPPVDGQVQRREAGDRDPPRHLRRSYRKTPAHWSFFLVTTWPNSAPPGRACSLPPSYGVGKEFHRRSANKYRSILTLVRQGWLMLSRAFVAAGPTFDAFRPAMGNRLMNSCKGAGTLPPSQHKESRTMKPALLALVRPPQSLCAMHVDRKSQAVTRPTLSRAGAAFTPLHCIRHAARHE